MPGDDGLMRWAALLVAVALAAGAPAFAGIAVDIRGVEGELADNVNAYLSLTRYKDRDVDTALMNRLHDRIDREVREALQPFGYYRPTIMSSVTPRSKGAWNVRIQIDPGPPVIVQQVDVEVTGPGAKDPQFRRILDRPTLHRGERLSHSAYEEMKSDLQRVAATSGYLDAHMTRSELRVDPAKGTASAFLVMASGVRYRFGETTIEQHVIDEALARRFMRYREGDPYDQTQLLRTQFALDDSRYFSTVEVQPREPDRIDHTVPILIIAQPNARDRYSFSAGYGTDTGPRGTLSWDRTRIGTSGSRFGVQLEASKLLQVLQAAYTFPINDPAVDRFSIIGTADYGIPGDLIDKDFAVGPSLTRVVGDWQYAFSVMPTHAITSDSNGTRTQELVVSSATIGSVPSGYLGQALFEQGLVAQLRIGGNITGVGGEFAQLQVRAQHAFDISEGWHLLLRGEAGATLVTRLNVLPGTFRFFAGGEGSVRGFLFDDLSPVQKKLDPATGDPVLTSQSPECLGNAPPPTCFTWLKVGGRDVLTGSVEVVRDIGRSFGVAVFSDFGNAFDTFGRSPNPLYQHFLEYSAGLGFRWRLPVITVGVDVAQPLSRPGAGPRFDIFFGPKL
ncbi:MAG TPA: POTRA domain-containing protein [Steroidobacteraceae bacterium]|nr:POTRA domain-containing protein [Steroidobacteraceae bacterium]